MSCSSLRLLPLLSFAALVLLPGIKAATIVDTGPGTQNGGSIVASTQSLAAEFSIAGPMTISSVEGWMALVSNVSQTLGFSIYGDGGNIPNTSSLLFSANRTVTGPAAPNWIGVSGLNWSLATGTYWVVFSGNGTFGPNLPSVLAYMPGAAPFPLGNEASYQSATNNWTFTPSANRGVRIMGEPTQVPDAATTSYLVAAALLCLGAVRRRRAG